MNTSALKTMSTHGGPIVLGGGLMLAAVAIVGLPGHARTVAQGQPPAVTASPSSSSPPSVRRSPHPSPARSTSSGAPVVAAGRDAASGADRTAGGGHAGSGSSSGDGSGGGGSTAQPTPPAGGSSGGTSSSGVSASVHLPLGVLPELGLDLKVGGTR